MFSRLLMICFVLLIGISPITAKGALTIDDFEDGTYTEDPKWWVFGKLEIGRAHV